MICQSARSSWSHATSSSSRSVWRARRSRRGTARAQRRAARAAGTRLGRRSGAFGRMAAMPGVILASTCRTPTVTRCPPTARSRPDRRARPQMLGDPDPDVRDEHRLPDALRPGSSGVSTTTCCAGLGDGMAAGCSPARRARHRHRLPAQLLGAGPRPSASTATTARPRVPGGKVLEWGDRLATWLLRERDLRGFVPGKGWAHAVAHGADAFGALARSPHLRSGRADRAPRRDRRPAARTPTPRSAYSGEADRLAMATMQCCAATWCRCELLEPWIAPDRRRPRAPVATTTAADPSTWPSGNAEAFLRALYLQLALGRRAAAVRSDLLLLLVEAAAQHQPGVPRPVASRALSSLRQP